MKTKALILAGGKSSRFAPFSTNKTLFRIFQKPIILHKLEEVRDQGFEEAVVVASPANQDFLEDIKVKGLSITKVLQEESTGMAGAVLSAKNELKDSPVFIINTADMFEGHIWQETKAVLDQDKPAITALKTDHYFPGGYLAFKGDTLDAIFEKPRAGNEPSSLLNLVMHYFPRADIFIEYLQKASSAKDDIYEVALSSYIKDQAFEVITYEGDWLLLKYPFHILEAVDFFLQHQLTQKRSQSASIATSASIDENVYIGENVKIFENAVIKGPCYIGDNTVVGTNSLVRHSIIENDCLIGFNSEIARSYIGEKTKLHTNYIGDSVLESNISMGSGAKTANLRLDEQTVKVTVKGESIDSNMDKLGALIADNASVGINASLMPGVKVGQNAKVGPGTVCSRDVEADQTIFVKQNLEIKNGGN